MGRDQSAKPSDRAVADALQSKYEGSLGRDADYHSEVLASASFNQKKDVQARLANGDWVGLCDSFSDYWYGR